MEKDEIASQFTALLWKWIFVKGRKKYTEARMAPGEL